MILLLNCMILLLLNIGVTLIIRWLWDTGVQEIVVHTEHFLLSETKKLRVKILPEVNSTKPWDRLELLLFYSGIRNYFPFVSAKVWIIFCVLVLSCSFLIVLVLGKKVWQAAMFCIVLSVLMRMLLGSMRRRNLRNTERYLLELLNVTESFAATGEEPIAILSHCSPYLKGPIGQALRNVDRQVNQGWSGRMILEQLKVRLEHPKWQEFIHNLNVCSMYNSDFSSVFGSSRKSIQLYLTSKKERQSIKHTAEMEMAAIVVLSLIIIMVLSNFLMVPISELMWGDSVSKGCTMYMGMIVLLFFWKIGAYEKE